MRLRSLLVALAILVPAVLPATSSARLLHPTASAAKAKKRKAKKPAYPVVTSISPRKLAVGKTLKVRGKNFRAGKGKNTIVFQRSSGGRYVFVKAGSATTRTIKVTIPSKLNRSLSRSKGKAVATRFRLRVLSTRFGVKFTSKALSPVVTPGSGSGTTTVGSCDPNSTGDSDRDGLSNALEKKIGTDPCLADTDGDHLTDFWEYYSAVDYNDNAHYTANNGDLPYPGKRPYPNPLDPSDAKIDHDGDGMTAAEEFQAWAKYGTPGSQYLFMSDGTQNSMERKPGFGYQPPAGTSSIEKGHLPAPSPTPAAPWRLDINGDGWLTDDERDADGDGLTNWDEQHGRMLPGWWKAKYTTENPYLLSKFTNTNWLDSDTDGDGVIDGRDDTDHDGWANWREVGRYHSNYLYGNGRTGDGRATAPGHESDGYGYWTNPFNPCLPDYTNKSFPDRVLDGVSPKQTCGRYIPEGQQAWAPFDSKAGCTVGDPRDLPPYRWYPAFNGYGQVMEMEGSVLGACPVPQTNPSPR